MFGFTSGCCSSVCVDWLISSWVGSGWISGSGWVGSAVRVLAIGNGVRVGYCFYCGG